MSKRLTRLGFVAVAALLFLLAAELPTGPMAGKSSVVVQGVQADGNQVAVTLNNLGASHESGQVVLMVLLEDSSVEQVVVSFSLNGGSTATYTANTSGDVADAMEHGITDTHDPM